MHRAVALRHRSSAGEDLGRANLADPRRVAADGVEIIVGNEVLEAPARVSGGCGNGRRIQPFEPFERLHRVTGQTFPARRARDKRLKQTRGRRRPLSAAMIAALVESHGNEEAGHGSSRILGLLTLLLVELLQIGLRQLLLEGDAAVGADPERCGRSSAHNRARRRTRA